MLSVVFEPSPALRSNPKFNASEFGTPAQVASMAYVAISESNGHEGVGDEAQRRRILMTRRQAAGASDLRLLQRNVSPTGYWAHISLTLSHSLSLHCRWQPAAIVSKP